MAKYSQNSHFGENLCSFSFVWLSSRLFLLPLVLHWLINWVGVRFRRPCVFHAKTVNFGGFLGLIYPPPLSTLLCTIPDDPTLGTIFFYTPRHVWYRISWPKNCVLQVHGDLFFPPNYTPFFAALTLWIQRRHQAAIRLSLGQEE